MTSRSDHLVGAENKRLRKSDTERFRCLEIKNELEFGRLLDREIGRLGTFQYFINVGRGAAEEVGEAPHPPIRTTFRVTLAAVGQHRRPWCFHRARSRSALFLFQATRTSVGNLSILRGKHARNAYRANDLAIDHNRDAALVRKRVLQPENSQPNSTPCEGIFKCLG